MFLAIADGLLSQWENLMIDFLLLLLCWVSLAFWGCFLMEWYSFERLSCGCKDL